VGRRGHVVHLEAVGFRDLEARAPLKTDAVFRIASMTKPITGLAVALLEEDGKLRVEDRVEKHLPEFRDQRVIKSKTADTVTLGKPARPITLVDLLTHTSGVPSMPPPGLGDLYEKRNRTLAEAVLAFSQRPLEFEPGSKWSYSNAGIDTAGRVVEAVSGKPFAKFVEDRIFRPLGMTDTSFILPPAKRARLASLYKREGDRLAPTSSFLGGESGVYPLPAGGLFSTAPDLARLYQMLLDRGAARGRAIARAETIEKATRVHSGDLETGFVPGMGFGLGCGVVKQPQGITEMLSPGSFGHGGAFGTQGWIDPGKQMYFILLIQRVGIRNADGSDLRRALQELAVAAIRE
jgi:CubicO group peptidase (beta-lactamase class C family)